MLCDRWRLLVPTILALALVMVGEVKAAPIVLFNTGVDASGTPLAIGATDPHWTIVTSTTTPAIVSTPSSLYATSPDSSWVWVNANGSGSGTHTFRLTFDLTGFDPSTVTISGAWGVDNTGEILLNGITPVGTGTFDLPTITTDNFTQFHNFVITGGFVAGVNTLDFVATDVDNLGGLNVNSLTGTATPAAVPEPSSVVLAGIGILGVLGYGLRRR